MLRTIAHAWQWLRSLVFVIQIYVMMGIMGIVFFPAALLTHHGARYACKLYCRWVLWSARWMVGLRGEVRGEVPTGDLIVAAKHQSFFDILLIFNALPAAKFIMKRELLWTPVIGQYAYRIGCVPVDRGKRGAAIKKMVTDVAKGKKLPGQLVIYPQGTRVAAGVKKPYKVGAAVLAEELGEECVPVATNVGVFWKRTGIYRKPGLAVVEFLPAIPAGLPRAEFMARLEEEVETASDALMREAGFDPDAVD